MQEDSDKLKIIVVTSSDFLNETFKRFLANKVCEVECFSDGLHCIKSAVEKSPSLIFLDMSLVGFHSLDTLKVLHSLKISKTTPIVIMVVNTQGTIVAESMDLGISLVLYKPFDRSDMLQIVDDLIGDKIREKTDSLPVMEAARIHAELKKKNVSVIEEKMTKMKLLKAFMGRTRIKRQEIMSALAKKESHELYILFTEIGPTASKIGYPRLSLLCDFMEKRLNCTSENVDWDEIERYTHEVICLIDQIQIENL